jgi:acyl transferase domain-containing protein
MPCCDKLRSCSRPTLIEALKSVPRRFTGMEGRRRRAGCPSTAESLESLSRVSAIAGAVVVEVDSDTLRRECSRGYRDRGPPIRCAAAEAQQTATLIQTLADKLSTAASAGDMNAREWALDLKEIALAVRDEQSTTTELLQAIHALVNNHVAAAEPSAPAYYPPTAQYAQPPQYQASYQPQYQQPAPSGGGALQRFLGGRFGQAIVTGAGIGIGDDIVNSIFDRF